MKKIISPGDVLLNTIAPPSKSVAIRTLAAGLLSLRNVGESINIADYPLCDDAIVAINIAEKMGYDILRNSINTITITKNNNTYVNTITCGESALCYRLFPYIASALNYDIEFQAEGTLRKRISEYNQPNVVTGEYEIDCSKTSQNLTALLYALPLCNSNSIITATNLYSRGYIDLTIDILQKFGINIEVTDNMYNIQGNQQFRPTNLTIESDWSATANLFVLGAIAGSVTVANLNKNSLQPDVAILNIFNGLDINYTELADGIFRVGKSIFNGFDYDASATPDLIPSLVVLALNATSNSRIYSIDRLINKESNRKDVIMKVFSMFGAKIRIDGNCFEVVPSKISGGFADSHYDHRIAMAIAIAAKAARKPTTLTGIECVSKSYPDFWNLFK